MNSNQLIKHMITCLAYFLASQLRTSGAFAYIVKKVDVPALSPQSLPQSIPATVFLPSPTGTFPAVVILHTCAGVDEDMLQWGQGLAKRGYVAIIADSFAVRGKKNCIDGRQLQRWERVSDAYSAAVYLKKIPSLEINKIGLLGFSYGGGTAVNIALNNSGNELFAAAVTFYPATLDQQTLSNSHLPLLVLFGEKDSEINTPQLLRWSSSNDAKGRLSIVSYPDSYHRFDHIGPQIEQRIDQTGMAHIRGYNKISASDARSRTYRFFDQWLKK